MEIETQQIDKTATNIVTSLKKMNKKILIVDDNALNITYNEEILKDVGYTVYTANNGREAVTMAKNTIPDLILMDLMMPIMGGLEATKILRDWGFAGVIAAFTGGGYKTNPIDAGCNTIIKKPVIAVKDFLKILSDLISNA